MGGLLRPCVYLAPCGDMAPQSTCTHKHTETHTERRTERPIS